MRSIEGLFLRWAKLLWNLCVGGGFGELEVEDKVMLSVEGSCLIGGYAPDCIECSSFRDPRVGTTLVETRGDALKGDAPRGEAASVGVLKG